MTTASSSPTLLGSPLSPVGVRQALSPLDQTYTPSLTRSFNPDVGNVACGCAAEECVFNEPLLLGAADADQVPTKETRLCLRVEPVGVDGCRQRIEVVVSARGRQPLDPFVTREDFS